jgi:chaperonin GroEL (HSP60 family)
LQTPVHTIATNAGVEGAVVVGKLLEQDNTDLGYDAAKGRLLNRILTNYLTLVLVQASYGMCDHLPQVNMLTW